jgi:two-component system CheB/CheR fusion protein
MDEPRTGAEARENRSVLPFPIVGIGASAGGVEALQAFFQHAPVDAGMAYIVVQHLSPEHQSLMAEILSRHTAMPVHQIKDGMLVQPNQVYVIAPGFTLTLKEGKLHLGEPIEKRGHRCPVDDFLRSLAQEQKERAIAVILSGTGTNGTAGAQAVKAAGGICVAQNPESAAFPGMPRSVVHAGYADQVVEAAEIPAVLMRYIAAPYVGAEGEARRAEDELRRDQAHLREVLALLRTRTRHDFSGYRKPTLLRRIQRRMGLLGLTRLGDYAESLRQRQEEAVFLANDLMVNVTGFFRNPEAWDALRTAVITPLCASKSEGEPVRAWVAACASGEEAYTLAIVIAEEFRARRIERPEVKIFATDTADKSLALARAGVFPGGIEADVPLELLDRYFDKDDHTYRVKKDIRDMLVFAPHDILRDPPFSRVELCTCRNLLIYLEPETQRRVVSLLHFSLRDGGYLFLGNTESASSADHLFEIVSKKWRIFRKSGLAQHKFFDLPDFAARTPVDTVSGAKGPLSDVARPAATLLLQRALLERYGPPTVVVDRTEHVVYFHGATDAFLHQPSGEPTRDLLQLVRPGLRLLVRTLLSAAMRENRSAVSQQDVRDASGRARSIEVTAEPVVQAAVPDYFLVSFKTLEAAPERQRAQLPAIAPVGHHDDPDQSQLRALRLELQSTIEAFEATSEELKASNEEAVSINEELQSSNEELETGKEELQSVNEELTTVNNQLQNKIAQLEATTNDLANLLSSTDIAVLFLDSRFRVRRFTPAVHDLLDLIEADIGRPVTDLAPKFKDEHLLTDARRVLDSLNPIERELQSNSGRWYIRRTLPYRTSDNHSDGVVITFFDVTARIHGRHQRLFASAAPVRDREGKTIAVVGTFSEKSYAHERTCVAGPNSRVHSRRDAR